MLINSIFFLAIWIISSFAEELSDNDVQSTKPTSLKFQEMRKRKDPIFLEYGGFLKKTQMGFQGICDKKDLIAPNVDDDFSHDEIDKRTLMGFHGIKGKKDYLMSNFKNFYLRNDYEKRALMGFRGMRGKKAMSEDGYYKRTFMGFHGMRGKKSMEKSIRRKKSHTFENLQGYEKRFLARFQDMHKKKKNFPTEWKKRAFIRFQGMRGKNKLLDKIEELEKGAIANFQGTRGKKNTFENYVNYYMDTIDKKVPMGFQGLRGKKDSDKRTPMRFQGMRGKRNMERRFGIDTAFETRSSDNYQDLQ